MPRVIPALPAETALLAAEAPPGAAEQMAAVAEQLVVAAEQRMDESGHARRVGDLAAALARKIGLPNDEVELIRHAAPMHDIGNLGIPDRILLKPGRLSSDEFDQIRRHVDIGAKMLSYGESQVLKMARLIARTHHERLDGSGYPFHLEGDEIPLPGQIVALADVFDTLTRRRPYRRAYSVDEALAKIERRSGSQFNPMLVTAFLRVVAEGRQKLRDPQRAQQGFQLRGTVDPFTLFDLLMSLDQNGRSGRLVIGVGYDTATLLLQRGCLVHADFAGARGIEAVQKMLLAAQRYAQLDFSLEPWSAADDADTGIRLPLARLLLGSAVTLDERLAVAS